ncbi:MAG: hypothetical protein WCR47_01890 [Desulfoplanes sp.]|jgi:hypothetical protein
MIELDQCFCPNEQCMNYGLQGQENIAIRGKDGKDKSRTLLYCRTSGKRFAAPVVTPCSVCICPPRRTVMNQFVGNKQRLEYKTTGQIFEKFPCVVQFTSVINLKGNQ